MMLCALKKENVESRYSVMLCNFGLELPKLGVEALPYGNLDTA